MFRGNIPGQWETTGQAFPNPGSFCGVAALPPRVLSVTQDELGGRHAGLRGRKGKGSVEKCIQGLKAQVEKRPYYLPLAPHWREWNHTATPDLEGSWVASQLGSH